MGRLQGTGYQGAFAQKVLLDGVRRDKDVGRFGLKMVLRRAQKTEPFLGYLEIARTVVGCAIRLCAHISTVFVRRTCPKAWRESHMNFEFRENRRFELSPTPEADGFGPATTD